MDVKKAFERNFAFKTEYGAGPKLLGGLYNGRILKRRRYSTSGNTRDDVVHEHELNLGPVMVSRRSTNPNLFNGDDYELAVTLLKIFAVSNDKDYWIKLRLGPSAGILGMIPGALPAKVVSALADCDVTARTGMRFNVSGFIRDLKDEEAEEGKSDPPMWDDGSRVKAQ
jgi:hypothetical protein